MVWNEYAYQAERTSDNEYSDDENEVPHDEPLHIDDWGGHFDDQLWYMWLILKRCIADSYLEHHFLKDAEYHDFIEFMYSFSDHRRVDI